MADYVRRAIRPLLPGLAAQQLEFIVGELEIATESHEADEAYEDIVEILLSAGYSEDAAAAEAKCRAVLAVLGLTAGGSSCGSAGDDNSAGAAAAPTAAAPVPSEEQATPRTQPDADPVAGRSSERTAEPCCAAAALAALLLSIGAACSAQRR